MDHLVRKEKDLELPVPDEWREVIVQIVASLISGVEEFNSDKCHINSIPKSEGARIAEAIAEYGDHLVPLTSKAWETSIYQYDEDFWTVLVDLCTRREGSSDLVLFIKVEELATGYSFTVEDVHVP
ncbi:MAG: hypothetical protein JKP96_03110 [Oceanicaulis sp.]|jgi:hypothetical protein|nr:hypothetical protein [Oceanicaulis sp.]